MTAMATANAENYTKPFADFPLALPRFPSLPPQLTSALANQIGSLWSPWPSEIQNAETSTVAVSPPSNSSSNFAFPSTQQQQQKPQQKDRFSLQSSSLTNLEVDSGADFRLSCFSFVSTLFNFIFISRR